MIRQRAVCDAADERGLAVLPFAVPLGAAGLRDPEGDDGFAAGRAFGFKVFDDVAHNGHGNLVDCRHDVFLLCGMLFSPTHVSFMRLRISERY